MALELQKQMYYLGDRDFQQLGNPSDALIQAAWQAPNGKGKIDTLLALELSNKQMRKIPIWGDNMNRLIDAYGADAEKWIGKRITIDAQLIDGKWIKTILATAGK